MKASFLRSGAVISLGGDRFFVGWGEREWIDFPEEGSFFFPPFFLDGGHHWFRHEESAVLSGEALSNLFGEEKKVAPLEWKFDGNLVFSQAFFELKELFLQEKLLKAVPYLFANASATRKEAEIGAALHALLGKCAQFPLYLYGFWDEEEGMVGATPEQLFYLRGDLLETVACAATAPREKAGGLLADPKMVREQQVVVEMLAEELAPFGRLKLGQVSPRVVGKIAHLVTPIQLTMTKQTDFDLLVRMLHPTPALGVAPKQAGRDWLERYDRQIPRGRFGAPAGCLLKGESQCLVAIRNVQWKGVEQRIGVGCGVVQESVLEQELEELEWKLRAICEAIGE